MVPLKTGFLSLVKVIGSQIVIRFVGEQDVIDDDQQLMFERHNGFFLPSATGDAVIER